MNPLRAALRLQQRRVEKAHGAHTHSRTITWRGLSIGIENDVGSTRSGTGPEGDWATTMTMPYGEIAGVIGVDGDPLDAFVNEGGLDSATHAYVVHTAHPGTGRYDEDKVLLGFDSPESAIACFAAHYDEPARHFGALTRIPIETFLARTRNPAQQGRAFTTHTETRVRLGQKRLARARAAREERDDWMKALVSKAVAVRTVAKGLTVEQIDARVSELQADEYQDPAEVKFQLSLLSYARAGQERSVHKALSVPEGDLYFRCWPGRDAFDLQNELITVDLIAKSWAYYEACGNIDLEHISKSGGKTWKEKAALIAAAGFEPENAFGRIQYEIGRPVPGSLRIESVDEHGYVEDFSFVWRLHGGDNECANWFRSTLPDIPWKPSVGGQMSEPVKVMTEVSDPRRGLKARKQEVKVARDFRWNNVAMSLETVNHWVRPIELLSPDEVAALLAMPAPPEKVSA